MSLSALSRIRISLLSSMFLMTAPSVVFSQSLESRPAAESQPVSKNNLPNQSENSKENGNQKTLKISQQDLDFLFQQSHGPSSSSRLVSQSNALYVDLKREIERLQRETVIRQAALEFQEEAGESLNELTAVKNHLKDLEKMRASVQELEKAREAVSKEIPEQAEKNENLKRITKLYETIAPDKVAVLMKQLPLSLTLEILHQMNPKKSAQVLAEMDSHFASEVSRRFVQYVPPSLKSTQIGEKP